LGFGNYRQLKEKRMSNPTTPFGWQMPTATDLVTDLPADFEVFGQAVATSMADLLGGTTGQILSKTSATDMDFTWTTPNPGDITGVTAGTGISGGGTSGDVTVTNSMATAMTTSGDLIQATGSGTFARLATGTSGQYLTTNGTTNSWASVSGANWSLLNAGGTALTGAQTITVSGISGKDKIMVMVLNAGSASGASIISIRLNTDTGANYATLGMTLAQPSTYSATSLTPAETLTATNIPVGKMGSSVSSKVSGNVLLSGCNSSGVKVYQASGTGDPTANSQIAYAIGGYYNSASTISSVSVFSSVGNFDEGTVYVYTSA
jgi:hypothetical protein